MKNFLYLTQFILYTTISTAQTVGPVTGCLSGRWGVDGGVYSGVIEYGNGIEPAGPPRSRDWFLGAAGEGVIDESNPLTLQTLLQAPGNPIYERRMKYPVVSVQSGQQLIDALYARDWFGGSGTQDPTTFLQSTKNGDNPTNWTVGSGNVLGKNDIIDIASHMWRDGTNGLTDNLWFVGFVNVAEPGGSAYLDFEFYVADVQYNATTQKIETNGPNLGHTAYQFDISQQKVTVIGDFLLAMNLGSTTFLEARIWVSRADWLALGGATNGGTTTFDWTGTFDGAFNGAPFGYAGIAPKNMGIACGYINTSTQAPLGPPWGTKTTKDNLWSTNYPTDGAAIELAIDLTSIGLDHASLSTADPCFFPLASFMIKTRSSQSFTAELKDFGGPYKWAFGNPVSLSASPPVVSCSNSIVTISATPGNRTDLKYLWQTTGGNITNTIPLTPNYKTAKGLVVNAQGDTIAEITGNAWEILADKPGTYSVSIYDINNCQNLVGGSASIIITEDPTDPLFSGPPVTTFTAPCANNIGTITTSVAGATPPYTFQLFKNGGATPVQTATNVASPHTFTGLDAGSYEVVVKGQSACTVTSDPLVLPPAQVPAFTPTIVNLDCFGDTDGSISLGTVTGKTPLQYAWSTGATSTSISNLGAGTYTLTITDADGCNWNYTYNITSPQQLTASIAKVDDPGNNAASGPGGGSATVTASGGTGSYLYAWAKIGFPAYAFSPSNTASAITNLSFGEYVVTVTDNNGCVTTASVYIFEKEICNDGIDNNGNGTIDCDDQICIPTPPATITPSTPIPCVGDQVTYTASAVAGITEFVWTVPANATLVSGQNTNQIVVEWQNTNGGQICVQSKSFDCLSAPTCITVQVQTVPVQPSPININNN